MEKKHTVSQYDPHMPSKFDCLESSLLRVGIFIHLGKPSCFLTYGHVIGDLHPHCLCIMFTHTQ